MLRISLDKMENTYYTDISEFLTVLPRQIETCEARLRQVSLEVDELPKTRQKLADFLLEMMYRNNGQGLSAPQLNLFKRVFVFCNKYSNVPQEHYCFNPRVTWQSTRQRTATESCLSIPGVRWPVPRPTSILVEYEDVNRNLVKKLLQDLDCRIFLHELDHLNGRLITDYSPKQKSPTDFSVG